MVHYIFDLDGTITKQETLPQIASKFSLKNKLMELSDHTISGEIPYIESFIRRVHLLAHLPVDKIDELLSGIETNDGICGFIRSHSEQCSVVTGNLGCWISSLCQRIECETYTSEAEVNNNAVTKITKILKKEEVVQHYQDEGCTVVYVGEGNNDLEAMRQADIAIACGLIHKPASSILGVADYVIYDETALIRQLEYLYKPVNRERMNNISVVISCAGIGARLGLATTKALLDVGGKTIIERQLETLKDVDDIRIVVGYQASDVIEEVKKYRPDAIFCYNHEYFETKTGASLYLGARHGGEYIVAVDGDLLVHPIDMRMLLSQEGEWIGYSDVMSDDAVFLSLNEEGNVTSFSRDYGDFEWTGPACIKRDCLHYEAANVFNQIEPVLPIKGIKVRACDIDTYDDYVRAIEFVSTWG